MQASIFSAQDGKDIQVYHWSSAQPPKAVLLIVHGLAEHGERYDRLASYLNDHDISVMACDHRGHGRTADSVDDLGFRGPGDFWALAIADVDSAITHLREKYPDAAIHVMGHSMGSLMLRGYIARHSTEQISSVVLSGTAGDPGPIAAVGRWIAIIISWIKGRDHRSKTLTKLSFGKFNDEFKPQRTDFDWLSRDESEVDKYIKDEYCGFDASAGLWIDLLAGVKYINSNDCYRKTSDALPIFLFAGDKDPVGDQGKGVQQVHDRYVQSGQTDIQIKLYKNARHECVNETNRTEVYTDIKDWLLTHS